MVTLLKVQHYDNSNNIGQLGYRQNVITQHQRLIRNKCMHQNLKHKLPDAIITILEIVNRLFQRPVTIRKSLPSMSYCDQHWQQYLYR